jgi:site-specific recombinase XerD
MQFLTQNDLTAIFKISTTAIQELVNTGKIPFKKLNNKILFSPDAISRWIKRPELNMNREKYIERYKKRIEQQAPEGLKAVQIFGTQFAEPWIPKKFYLNKVKNKKLGFVYYVRYLENGKLIPSSWCTHTNNIEEAKNFAIVNREFLLSRYYEKAAENKPHFDVYSVFKNYYAVNSPYLETDIERGRSITDKTRRVYHNFMNSQFIPYLRQERIKSIEEIDTPLLSRFQKYLKADKKKGDITISGVKPQTIRIYIGQIGLVFDNLIQENRVTINPVKSLIKIKVKKEHVKITGCYEVEKIKGVFNRKWKNEMSYLMSLLMYTTNMRNIEIENIRLKDIFIISKYHYINIPESKTLNGIRIVPLHDFVYRKIMCYVRKNNITDYIFKSPKYKRVSNVRYKRDTWN